MIVNWRIHKTIRYHHEGTKDTKMKKIGISKFYFVTFVFFVVETLLTFGCGFAALGSLWLP
jgi:hypothetical protein